MAKKKKIQIKRSSAQFWRYKELGQDPHQILQALVGGIRKDQSDRYMAYKEYEALYRGAGMGIDRDFVPLPADGELSVNELANTIETLHAQVFKNRVVPQPYCVGSNFEQWDRAKLYGRWLDGVWDSLDLHSEVVPRAGMHCLIDGTGFIKIGYEMLGDGHAKLTSSAINPKRIYVDKLEASNGNPRTIHCCNPMDRFQAIQQWGEDDEDYYGPRENRVQKLQDLKLDIDDEIAVSAGAETDQIAVWETWHLPSSADADDGMYVVWVRGCTLAVYPWKRQRFPFVKMIAFPPIDGFYGDSAVRRLAPAQKAYDKLNKRIDLAHDLMGVPRLIKRKGAGLNAEELNDVPGSILEVEGDPRSVIQEWNPVPITPDAYRQRDQMPQMMRSVIGVSGLESSMQLPPQLREFSGKAFEAYQDTSSARHAMLHRSYEHSMVGIADVATMQAEELSERGISVIVKARTGYRQLDEIDFSDILLDRDSYILRVDPVSQLSKSLPAKIKDLKTLKDEGFLKSQSTAARLLEMPELEAEIDLGSSDEEIILKNLQYMVREQKYLPPLPYDNLDLIVALTTRFINHYRVSAKNYDEEIVGILSQYIDEALALKPGLGGPSSPGQPMAQGAPFNAPPGMVAPPGAVPPPGPSMGPPGSPPIPPMGP